MVKGPNLNVIPAATRASMQANRRRDTSPELRLRHALHALGYRYRVDRRLTVGENHPRPDIVFGPTKVAVFVDGCYWHGCPEHFTMPKTNTEFWRQKITRNQARDARDTQALEEAGWVVLRIWEHVPLAEAVQAVRDAVSERKAPEPVTGPPQAPSPER